MCFISKAHQIEASKTVVAQRHQTVDELEFYTEVSVWVKS